MGNNPNSNPNVPHFVWVRVLGGLPQPQKWETLDYGVNGRKLKSGEVLDKHALTPGLAALPIDELAKLYPCPPRR